MAGQKSSIIADLGSFKGTNPEDGGTEMVYYETASRGRAFSVGSISYRCSIALDDGISKITGNAPKKFSK